MGKFSIKNYEKIKYLIKTKLNLYFQFNLFITFNDTYQGYVYHISIHQLNIFQVKRYYDNNFYQNIIINDFIVLEFTDSIRHVQNQSPRHQQIKYHVSRIGWKYRIWKDNSFQQNNKFKLFSKTQVKQLLTKLNCNSIIFTSKNESGNDLCENLLQEMRNSRAEQLKFNPQDILFLFDLEEINEELEFQLEDLICQLVSGLRKLIKPFREQLQNHSPQTPQGISNLCKILVEIKNKSREHLEMFELKNYSFLIGLEQQEKFTAHKRLIKCLEQELQNLFSFGKREFENKKQAEANYLKVVGSENIDCSFEKNNEWKIQLQQNKIEEQKKRIITL